MEHRPLTLFNLDADEWVLRIANQTQHNASSFKGAGEPAEFEFISSYTHIREDDLQSDGHISDKATGSHYHIAILA